MSRDVTFHEEAAFRQFRELQFDTDMEEHENPSTEITVPNSPRPEIQREESDEISDPVDPIEPVELLERSLDAPPAKRRPAWIQETLQEAERRAAPLGTFRES